LKKRWRTRIAVLALLMGGSVTAVTTTTATSAAAAANCHWNNVPFGGFWGTVQLSGSTGDMRYPATLHGATITLQTHSADASVRVTASGLRQGDVLSVDRSNFRVAGSAEYYFQSTAWVQARGTWDYCESPPMSGSGIAVIEGVDGAHRYIRTCLRRSGALQCTNMWYGDNDDETGDATRTR
jgi:hypothetical protein